MRPAAGCLLAVLEEVALRQLSASDGCVGGGGPAVAAVSWRPLPGPAGARFTVEKQLGAAWRPASHRLPPPPPLRQSVYPAVSPRAGDLEWSRSSGRGSWWPVLMGRETPGGGATRVCQAWAVGSPQAVPPPAPPSWSPGFPGSCPGCADPQPGLGRVLGSVERAGPRLRPSRPQAWLWACWGDLGCARPVMLARNLP